MLCDELQALELTGSQLRHPVDNVRRTIFGTKTAKRGIRHPSYPFKLCHLPRRNARVSGNLRQNGRFGQGQRVIFR